VFDDDVVTLTPEEDDAYVIACYETPNGEDYPDPADFVTDEYQRFLNARVRLLSAGAAQLDAAVAADRDIARAAASRARALAAFARSRPAAMFDRAFGEQGAASAASVAARPAALTEVSEWAVDEAAATFGLSKRAASLMVSDAVTLVEVLPATLAALSAGDVSPAQADVLVELVGPVSTAQKRAAVEAAVLPRAPQQTISALRACVRRAVTRIDAAAAAERLARALRNRKVRLDARDDGMSAMTVLWATPLARACMEALSAYAKACEYDDDGNRDPRTHDQRMTDCLADLILRPHGDHPAVRILLTLVAGVDTLTGHGPGADEPGEVNGDLVPAALVRELAYTLGLLPRPETAPASDEATPADAAAGAADHDAASSAVGATPDAPDAETVIAGWRAEELAAAEELRSAYASAHRTESNSARPAGITSQAERAREALTRLVNVRRLIDTALAERPRIAIAEQLSGELMALTDSTELRGAATAGRGLGPPPGTEAYRPTDPLYRFVQLRDRRCRFPGCRTPARCCDLDHQVPHPHGMTAHDNLACLCEHHHRLSHQAPGWRLHRDPDGGLVWTLPSGRTVTTHPPAFGTDDGSTPTVSSSVATGRQRYADLRAVIGASRAVPADALVPF
jgi:hypothetical protein